MKTKLGLVAILFFSLGAKANWLDPKDIRKDLQPTDYSKSNVTETDFRAAINKLVELYSPLATRQGGKLSIAGDWKSETPNAGATQMFGNWQVKITGGLARRPELSQDGFSLIICHELGHHFAGFVIGPAQSPFEKAWAANEGQADYFSTHVCAKRLWGDDIKNNSEFRRTVSAKIQRICNRVWTTKEEQDLCYRTLTAAESVTTTMAAIVNKPAPDFDTPDPSAVSQTNHNHPEVQCRLDTLTQGSVCLALFDALIIPGKNAAGGVAGLEAEKEAASFSCTSYSGFSVGLRPTCWFKPRL